MTQTWGIILPFSGWVAFYCDLYGAVNAMAKEFYFAGGTSPPVAAQYNPNLIK